MSAAKSLLLSLIVSVLLLQSAVAHAEGDSTLIGLSVFAQANLRQKSAQNETNGFTADLHWGWTPIEWLFLGATFDYQNERVKTTGYSAATDNLTTNYQRMSAGPTIGIVLEGAFLLYTYHLESAWRVKTSPSNDAAYTDTFRGTGSQIDAGWLFAIGSIRIGPQISYRSFSYTKVTNSGTTQTLSPQLKESQLDPLLAVWMRF